MLVLSSLLKSGTDDYFSINWILVKIDTKNVDVCVTHELGRILINIKCKKNQLNSYCILI
jgi:hypothetical protein